MHTLLLGCSVTDAARRFVDYLCVVSCFEIWRCSCLYVRLFCFRIGDVFCDVLWVFVAISGFSINVFRSKDVRYVRLR